MVFERKIVLKHSKPCNSTNQTRMKKVTHMSFKKQAQTKKPQQIHNQIWIGNIPTNEYVEQKDTHRATTRAEVKTLIKPMGNQVLENWVNAISRKNATDIIVQCSSYFYFWTLFHFQIDHLFNWITRNDGTNPNTTPRKSPRSVQKVGVDE